MNSSRITIQPLAIAQGSRIANDIANVPSDKLPIMEMFHGIEGEGLLVGQPRILIRLGGCRVSCKGCDSPTSWGLKASVLKDVKLVMDELLALVLTSKVSTVAITGGEPMHYPQQITELSKALQSHGIKTWLETSGLILDEEVFSKFDYVSIDVKTPSSGVACFSKEALATFKAFIETSLSIFQVKMVVTDEDDALWVLENFKDWLLMGTPNGQPLVITPAGGVNKGVTVLSYITGLHHRVLLCQNHFSGYEVRIIAQQHQMLGLK